jgi:hypothetical protein
MKKLLYARDSEQFWEIFDRERAKNRSKLAKLPFAKKIAILEQMQQDARDIRASTKYKTK